jgi:hypothetical protein
MDSAVEEHVARYAFWIPTIFCIAALLWWMAADPYKVGAGLRNWILTALFATYFSKLFGVFFLLIDDFQRLVRWIAQLFSKNELKSNSRVK